MDFFKHNVVGILIWSVFASLIAAFILWVTGHLPHLLGVSPGSTTPAPPAVVDGGPPVTGPVAAPRDAAELAAAPPKRSKAELNQAMFGAAKTKDWDQVRALIEQGADVNARDEHGKTVLFWSLAWPDTNNSTDLAAPKMLIQHGADVDAELPDCASCARPNLGVPSVAGFSALHCAAWAGDQPLAELLVGSGATLDALDAEGRTPLYAAVDLGQDDVAKYLVSHGASAPKAIEIAEKKGNDSVKRWFNANGFPN